MLTLFCSLVTKVRVMAAEVQQHQEEMTLVRKQARVRAKREGRELALAKKQAAVAHDEASKLELERRPLAVELERLDKLLYGRGGGVKRAQSRAKAKELLSSKKGSPSAPSASEAGTGRRRATKGKLRLPKGA
jgi:hypothetical protein